jgi:hypothetical protein
MAGRELQGPIGARYWDETNDGESVAGMVLLPFSVGERGEASTSVVKGP